MTTPKTYPAKPGLTPLIALQPAKERHELRPPHFAALKSLSDGDWMKIHTGAIRPLNPADQLENVLAELVDWGMVDRNEESYRISDAGRKVLDTIQQRERAEQEAKGPQPDWSRQRRRAWERKRK